VIKMGNKSSTLDGSDQGGVSKRRRVEKVTGASEANILDKKHGDTDQTEKDNIAPVNEGCDILDSETSESTTISTKGINDLPPEIMIKIFQMMNNKDLSNVVSVCSWWRDMGERLWNWDDGILIVERCDINMLKIIRVEHVEEILIEYDEDWSDEELNELFETLTNLSKLTYFNMEGIKLTNSDPRLLVNAMVTINTVDLSMCELTDVQLNNMFTAIDETTKLRTLKLKGVDLSAANKDILAAGVNKLECVNLYETRLDEGQVTALLTQAGIQTELRVLCLDSNTIEGDPILHRVPGVAVDKEVVRMAKLNIGNLNMKYDFENNSQWDTYKAGSIVCYVTGQ